MQAVILAQVEPPPAEEMFLWDPFLLKGTPFAINRPVLVMLIGTLCLVAFFVVGARRAAVVPRGIANLAEMSYQFVRNDIAIATIGPEGAKYANFLAALFFFILFMNLFDVLPFFYFPATARMAIPALLALLSWIIFVTVGIKKRGPIKYFREILFPPGVPMAVKPLLALIELFSTYLIRPLTLAIRLLANMMAGVVLLVIFFTFAHGFLVEQIKPFTVPIGVVSVVVAAVLILFELLVIGIQAYIFTMLTAFYIQESIYGHGGEEEDEEEEEREPQRETEGIEEEEREAA